MCSPDDVRQLMDDEEPPVAQAVTVARGLVFRLAPKPEQERALTAQGHAARALWNRLHAWWTEQPETPSYVQADAWIRQQRHEVDWLGELPAQAAQQLLKHYHRAWRDCWAGRKRPPRFKARHRSRMAIDMPQADCFRITRLNRRRGELTVVKVGRVRFRWSRPIPGINGTPGRLTGARLVCQPNGWQVIFRAEIPLPLPTPHPGPAVGLDRGVTIPLALSQGTIITHDPWLTAGEVKRLLRLQRKAARQKRARKPGEQTSNRLHRTYDQIAGIRARAKRRRRDWQHQTTTDLARRYATIVVEDLRVADLTRSAHGTIDQPGRNVRAKAGLNRAILDQGWGGLVELLAYKTTERGGRLVKVPAAFTSQTCAACGHVAAANRPSQASFRCVACGHQAHADVNAARNILSAAGLAVHGRGVA